MKLPLVKTCRWTSPVRGQWEALLAAFAQSKALSKPLWRRETTAQATKQSYLQILYPAFAFNWQNSSDPHIRAKGNSDLVNCLHFLCEILVSIPHSRVATNSKLEHICIFYQNERLLLNNHFKNQHFHTQQPTSSNRVRHIPVDQ